MPTASAVVADVIDCAKHMERKKFFGWQDGEPGYVADRLDNVIPFYVRLLTDNAAETIARAGREFGDIDMLTRSNAPDGEIAFVTDAIREGDFESKLGRLGADVKSVIRITDY